MSGDWAAFALVQRGSLASNIRTQTSTHTFTSAKASPDDTHYTHHCSRDFVLLFASLLASSDLSDRIRMSAVNAIGLVRDRLTLTHTYAEKK